MGSFSWWTESQLADLATKLNPSEIAHVREMSSGTVAETLRTFCKSFDDHMVNRVLEGLRASILSDMTVPVTGGIASLQTMIQTVNSDTKSLLEHTQKLPEAIESYRTRPQPAAKVGQNGENQVSDILRTKYRNVEDTSGKTASGDFRVDGRLMIEVKNYRGQVPQAQYDKFIRDVTYSREVTCAMYISSNGVVGGYTSPLHYTVRRIDCSRSIPIAIVSGFEPDLILNTCQLLLAHADVLDNISAAGEVNKSARGEISQMIQECVSDLRDLVTTRDSIQELGEIVSKRLVKISVDLGDLERRFQMRLSKVRSRLSDLLTPEETTSSAVDGSSEAVTKIVTGCKVDRPLAVKFVTSILAARPPGVPQVTYSLRSVNFGGFALHFTSNATSVRLPQSQLTRKRVLELIDVFSTRDYLATPSYFEIPLNEATISDITRICSE